MSCQPHLVISGLFLLKGKTIETGALWKKKYINFLYNYVWLKAAISYVKRSPGKHIEFCQESSIWFYFISLNFISRFCTTPRSRELRTQKLKSHLVRTQILNVLPLKPGVSQYIAIHATLTARDFFLAYFYTSVPFTCIFAKPSPDFSLCWLWRTHGSCVGPQNKIGHPAGYRFPCWVPAEYK